jgi:hypothetical protein
MRAMVLLAQRADDGGALVRTWLFSEHPLAAWTIAGAMGAVPLVLGVMLFYFWRRNAAGRR